MSPWNINSIIYDSNAVKEWDPNTIDQDDPETFFCGLEIEFNQSCEFLRDKEGIKPWSW